LVPDDETGTHPLEGKTVAMPRAGSTSPGHATLHAMAATHQPPGQTVVFPPPAGPFPAQSLGSAYDLVETKSPLPAKLGPRSAAAKIPCTFDMVEPMSYLYVTVVKARDLRNLEITDSPGLYVEVKMGKFKGVTRNLEKNDSPEWRQTFAFSRDHDHLVHRGDNRQLEVIVQDEDMLRDNFVGRVVLDMSDVPNRLPSDSPLAPQWYQLSDAHGNKLGFGDHGLGEIMLAIWLGTQADEAFPEAWHAVAYSLSFKELISTRSKVYYSPKLIYLKVSVITAQDLVGSEIGRPLLATIAKIQMGNQIRRTSPRDGTANPVWNEELMFVVSKPFVDPLVVTVEERVAEGRDEPIGSVIISVAWPQLPRNDLARTVPSKWYSLSREMTIGTVDKAAEDVTTLDEGTFASKIRLKMSLETAYHVLDESTDYSSDLQPAAKKLRKNAIGILEVGILSARGLGGMKNLYCIAKYGAKWVRTRTLLATAGPHWNDQYAWEVFDLSTVITIVVFDNANLYQIHGDDGANHQRIGKVRFRLTTLEPGQVHTHHYPMILLSSSGPKKTGELQLAVRFTCKSWGKMLVQYGRSLLPEMHYTNPISVLQLDYLQFHAMQMVANRLERADPPLRREVVEYMLDPGSQFSLRRSRANFYRLTALFSGTVAVKKWFDDICEWKNPGITTLIHVVFLTMVRYPRMILPLVFLYMIMVGVWNYSRRPWRPPHIDMMLSQVELASPDELDEELDTLRPPSIDSVLDMLLWYADQAHPNELNEELDTSTKPDGIVRMRYDRLRDIAIKVQTAIGDLAMEAERAQSLLSWRQPWVTPIFTTLSLAMAVVLYLTPFRLVAMVMGLYFLRPPWIRRKTNLLFNLYPRLSSKDDMML
jgi:hypothetical protein